jgi:hypothetical protein
LNNAVREDYNKIRKVFKPNIATTECGVQEKGGE